MPRKKYNTLHPKHVVKTGLTNSQYAVFTKAAALCNMSQAEYIRQVITGQFIRPTVRIHHVDDELLKNVSKLNAEYGRIGSSLNQIAKRLNEFGQPYNGMMQELQAASSELSVLKYEVQQKIGDAISNVQTYQLKKQ